MWMWGFSFRVDFVLAAKFGILYRVLYDRRLATV